MGLYTEEGYLSFTIFLGFVFSFSFLLLLLSCDETGIQPWRACHFIDLWLHLLAIYRMIVSLLHKKKHYNLQQPDRRLVNSIKNNYIQRHDLQWNPILDHRKCSKSTKKREQACCEPAHPVMILLLLISSRLLKMSDKIKRRHIDGHFQPCIWKYECH